MKRTVSTCAADGFALPFVSGQTNNLARVELCFAAVGGNNSSGDIAIAFSGAAGRCLIGIIACCNIKSATPTAINAGTTDAAALAASVAAGGIALWGAYVDTVATFNWSGDGTDHGDGATESRAISVASAMYGPAATATASPDASSVLDFCACMATFR